MLGGSGGGEEAGPPGLAATGGGLENEPGQGGSGEDRSFGSGNRWPRQETLALLKIRSDMDVAFRDSSAKGPLWEEISRKLMELGYNRSAKKCKEKFENVYKYHKRTREGRGGKQDRKTYRFFDQLEAFETHPPAPPPPIMPAPAAPNVATSAPCGTGTGTVAQNNVTPFIPNTTVPAANPSGPFLDMSRDLNSNSNSTSSSTFSDEGLQGGRPKRKRKWKDFFERVMKEVMEKQEELQNKFLEALERREHDRLVREESWRVQEMARINREREILAQERSMATAKDTAVIAFLQKIAEQQPGQPRNVNTSNQSTANPTPTTAVLPPPPSKVQLQPVSLPPVQPPPPPQPNTNIVEFRKSDNGDGFVSPSASSSRWPKVEVQALIRLRTNLDSKYQENVPKGPLWEEISAQMRRLGYDRNAKRCKEKWENINKYFKKVKESNKKRREDSKTCPYFQQLDEIYRERSIKVMEMPPLMVTPEQQWPPQQDPSRPDLANMDDIESDHMDNDDGDEEEDDEGGEYELVAASKAPSLNGDTQS